MHKCHFCGKSFVRVCSHVWQKHGMRSAEYKEYVGLNRNAKLTTPEYRERMREHVRRNGHVIVNNLINKGKKTRFQPGDSSIGTYERRPPTKRQLQEHAKKHLIPKGRLKGVEYAERVVVTCQHCGKEFRRLKSQLSNNNYCSRHCSASVNNKKRRLLNN